MAHPMSETFVYLACRIKALHENIDVSGYRVWFAEIKKVKFLVEYI